MNATKSVEEMTIEECRSYFESLTNDQLFDAQAVGVVGTARWPRHALSVFAQVCVGRLRFPDHEYPGHPSKDYSEETEAEILRQREKTNYPQDIAFGLDCVGIVRAGQRWGPV